MPTSHRPGSCTASTSWSPTTAACCGRCPSSWWAPVGSTSPSSRSTTRRASWTSGRGSTRRTGSTITGLWTRWTWATISTTASGSWSQSTSRLVQVGVICVSTIVPGGGRFQQSDLAGLDYGLVLGLWVVFTIIVSLTVTFTLTATVALILP